MTLREAEAAATKPFRIYETRIERDDFPGAVNLGVRRGAAPEFERCALVGDYDTLKEASDALSQLVADFARENPQWCCSMPEKSSVFSGYAYPIAWNGWHSGEGKRRDWRISLHPRLIMPKPEE